MAREPRIETPQGFYHAHVRGNNKQDIYFGNWSGRLFVRELERASRRHGWRVLAYCLMRNHYHLVFQIEERLSSGMKELNGRFARISNRANGRINHVFGSRFTSHPIEDEEYLLTSIRYVLRNPIRAGHVERAENWRWSSMRPTLALEHAPACLDSAFVLRFFGSKPHLARKRFREWVNAEEAPTVTDRNRERPKGPAQSP